MAEPLTELLKHLDGGELTPENIQAEIDRHERRLRLLRALADLGPDKPSKSGGRKPAGKPRGRKRVASEACEPAADKAKPADLSRRLGEFLKQNGPKRIDAIKNALDFHDQEALTEALAGDWFEKDNGLWTLSSEGNGAFRRDDD